MKYLWIILLPSLALAECNTAPATCSSDPDCPASGTVVTSWYFVNSGAPYCDASDCRMHQPTIRHRKDFTSAGNCVLPGTCFGATVIDWARWLPAADCVNTVNVCTSGACTAFGPWINQGCAANGCALGEMSQSQTATTPGCCTAVTNHQCVIDPTCPSPPKCGVGVICGTVVAWEKPTVKLLKMAMTLRDATGNIIRTQYTDANGYYSFTGLAAGSYSVRAEPDRTWNPIPGSIATSPNNIIGSADSKMMFVPAVVTVTGIPGELVAFTTTPVLTPAPPNTMNYATGSIDLDRQKKVNLHGGSDYYMTCWHVDETSWPRVWVKGPSQHINGGATLWPQDAITEACQ